MSKHKIIFFGSDESNTEDHQLECFCNDENEIYISVDMGNISTSFIVLDKSSAIKLSRVLKSEISKIQ